MSTASPLVRRPDLDRRGPIRTADRFYRAASDDPAVIGGLPLDSVESVATAAVRLGYKIAASQLDRSTRIAARLRDAGDRAAGVSRDSGDSSEKHVLDATEQLIFKSILAGLGWLEGVTAAPGNPLRRFAAAQFGLLGAMLGLTESGSAIDTLRTLADQVATATGSAGGAAAPSIDLVRSVVQTILDPAAGSGGVPAATGRASRAPADTGAGRRRGVIRVRHAGRTGKAGSRQVPPRAIQVVNWHLAVVQEAQFDLAFYGDAPRVAPLRGRLTVTAAGNATLLMQPVRASVPRGTYLAAILDREGLQLGFIEVSL